MLTVELQETLQMDMVLVEAAAEVLAVYVLVLVLPQTTDITAVLAVLVVLVVMALSTYIIKRSKYDKICSIK
jgi:ABC-type Fe3+ transport system permease subunit